MHACQLPAASNSITRKKKLWIIQTQPIWRHQITSVRIEREVLQVEHTSSWEISDYTATELGGGGRSVPHSHELCCTQRGKEVLIFADLCLHEKEDGSESTRREVGKEVGRRIFNT